MKPLKNGEIALEYKVDNRRVRGVWSEIFPFLGECDHPGTPPRGEKMVNERPRKKEKKYLNAKLITISRAKFVVIGVQLCSTVTCILLQERFLI